MNERHCHCALCQFNCRNSQWRAEVKMKEQPLAQTPSANAASALDYVSKSVSRICINRSAIATCWTELTWKYTSGELVALVGGSGSGKTTLLRHIIGLDHPDKGRVLVADHESQGSPLVDLGTLDATGMERLQRHWAVVFQGNALLSGVTVADNIALPLREVQHLNESTIRSRVNEAVREVALNRIRTFVRRSINCRAASPSGLRSPALWRLIRSSFSTTSPPLASTHGSPRKSKTLIGAVHHRQSASGFNRTSLLITHDKAMLYRLRPRIVMLDAGHIVFDGTYEAFQNSDSPVTRPYFDLMPRLHQRLDGSEDLHKQEPARRPDTKNREG